MPASLRRLLLEMERSQAQVEAAANGEDDVWSMTVVLALSFGGRDELVRAVQRLAAQVQEGRLAIDGIDEAALGGALSSGQFGLPDPDLCIRTGGEHRLSNFLLWESAYAELCIVDEMWPDFSEERLLQAFDEYRFRQRRFGT